jgi:hypothetical protein
MLHQQWQNTRWRAKQEMYEPRKCLISSESECFANIDVRSMDEIALCLTLRSQKTKQKSLSWHDRRQNHERDQARV